jgi:hypothetical protein
MENQLRDAIAVAQMDEDHSTQIAAAMDPAHQQGALSSVRGAQFPAGICTAKVA